MKRYIIIFTTVLTTGCSYSYTDLEDGSVPDATTTDQDITPEETCELNFSYKNFTISEPARGRWHVLPKESGGVRGSFTIITSGRDWNGALYIYTGYLYYNLKFRDQFLVGFFRYEGICNPNQVCVLRNAKRGSPGGMYYIFNASGVHIKSLLTLPDRWTFKIIAERTGDIGDCRPGEYHCYLDTRCTTLVMDCISSKNLCRNLGSLSYQIHTDQQHCSEECYTYDIQVK